MREEVNSGRFLREAELGDFVVGKWRSKPLLVVFDENLGGGESASLGARNRLDNAAAGGSVGTEEDAGRDDERGDGLGSRLGGRGLGLGLCLGDGFRLAGGLRGCFTFHNKEWP